MCRLLIIALLSSLLKIPEFCLDRGVNPLWLLSPVAWPCGGAKPGEGGPSTNMVTISGRSDVAIAINVKFRAEIVISSRLVAWFVYIVVSVSTVADVAVTPKNWNFTTRSEVEPRLYCSLQESGSAEYIIEATGGLTVGTGVELLDMSDVSSLARP